MGAEQSALSVAETLRRLGDEGVTGCLQLQRGAKRGQVWLREGQVYTAAAPEARPRLGDRLVGAGHISQEQLEAALQLQRATPNAPRIGELLVSTGLIDRETMQDYVQDQILDSVAAVLGWSDGEWTFQAGEEVTEDIALDLSTENLLMDATRRLEEFEVIRGRLGSLDAIVDFSGASQAEVALTPDEWAMLTRIDGSSSVRDLAESSGYSQLETARIVYGLLTAGVVQIVGQAESAEPEPEAPVRTGKDVDRHELLREFAALDDEPPARAEPRPQPRPEPRPQPRSEPPAAAQAPPVRRAQPQRAPEPDERKGLFGRFRKS